MTEREKIERVHLHTTMLPWDLSAIKGQSESRGINDLGLTIGVLNRERSRLKVENVKKDRIIERQNKIIEAQKAYKGPRNSDAVSRKLILKLLTPSLPRMMAARTVKTTVKKGGVMSVPGLPAHTIIRQQFEQIRKKIMNLPAIYEQEEKPFKCPHCDESFDTKEELTQHVKSEHGTFLEAKTYPCVYCDVEPFSTKADLKDHVKTEHAEKYQAVYGSGRKVA